VTQTVPPETETEPVQPVGGAGLYDLDPDQGDVSEDPSTVVVGDVDAMPEDWEY
jgi:hypothetical protein